ncbi:MAG TPA: 5'/3'-nucleotidase SurE [Phycisphaerae bacterium]|nr:5'/3'-nucleotidase SurE [Phycisphaerae bacterium]
MRILLTNDDGIYAPGILAMHGVLTDMGPVDVVAPETVQSGGSHAITIRHPVLWRSIQVGDKFTGTSVEGTPGDCVKLAINALLGQRPDLVVSGINAGLNTGIHVLYSGTVAAAIEAAILGCPAIAVSFELYKDMEFDIAAGIARSVIDRIGQEGFVPGTVYNINIPELKPGLPRGVRVAPQSILPMDERIERRSDPYGREYYWLTGDFKNIGGESDTDRYMIQEGYVCVTPLRFDLTERTLMKKMEKWEWPDVATKL